MQAVDSKKIVKYDVDGYDIVTNALKDLLNEYPGLETGEVFKFSTLKEDDGIAFYPVSGAIIAQEKKSVTGKVNQLCNYPFYIVYRTSRDSPNMKADIKEFLDSVAVERTIHDRRSKIVPLIATISSAVLGFAGHIGTLIDILKGGGGLIGVIGQVVSTFGIVPIAIAAAIAAIILIATHWDQLKVVMSNLMNWIKGVFAVDWNAQLGVLGEGIEVLLSTVKGVFDSIKQICSGFISFFKLVFTGQFKAAGKELLNILRAEANMIYSIFKTPVNEVIALFNAMGQAIVKAINNLIDGLNHIKVPDWVPGIGGKGINLSHANFTRVPYLAQGAVIPAGNPFLAVLGDQTKGNNLEMPENLLRKIVSEESGKGTGMIKLVVNLDSRTVLEQLINTAKEMQMSNGQNVFELGR